jgi:p-aminobenzoyl-glutamate transporter AbgT
LTESAQWLPAGDNNHRDGASARLSHKLIDIAIKLTVVAAMAGPGMIALGFVWLARVIAMPDRRLSFEQDWWFFAASTLFVMFVLITEFFLLDQFVKRWAPRIGQAVRDETHAAERQFFYEIDRDVESLLNADRIGSEVVRDGASTVGEARR